MSPGSTLIFLLALLSQAGETAHRPPTDRPFIARKTLVLEAPAGDPLRLPTAVAIAPTGHVFVADGVNNRIVEFGPDGIWLGSFGGVEDQALSRPMSLKVNTNGELWIADTGNGRIIVRGPEGTLIRQISVPGPIDLTDVVPVQDSTVWLIDNEHHRIVRHRYDSGESQLYGQSGEARGQFHYPFMAAAGPDGVLFVSDAINGRVQAIRDFQVVPRVFGSYGVEPGQFHRPKGIAVDGSGRLVVADGSLGVIQFFAPDGSFLDALCDESGTVMRFDTPCGIAIDGSSLFVTEMLPGRVVKLTVQSRDVKPDFSQPVRPLSRPSQPTTCTVCHLEWMPEFGANTPTALSKPPASRPGEPYVSSARSCLTCHDGSVVDSRREVWRDHGHQTGVVPPDGMNIPRDMPLVDDAIACRTCHSAHTRGGAGQTMANSVFLRVAEDPDELCVRCHADHKGGLNVGSHPTTGFADPLQEALVRAGARYSFKDTSSGCLVCHTGHGSRHERLLIPMASTQSLCVACHTTITLDPSATAAVRLHPMQVRSVAAESTRQSGDLECVSCHKIHHAPERQALLRKTQQGSTLCMDCHSKHQGVLGTPHDLSVNADTNSEESVSCRVAGPCASCHGVHSPAFRPVVTREDLDGTCVACHQSSGCATNRTGQPFLHPTDVPVDQLSRLRAFTGRTKSNHTDTLTCLSCHDPHAKADRSPMLRGKAAEQPTELCFECHTEMRPIATSFHRAAISGHGESKATDCHACHAIHALQPDWPGGMWIAPRGTSPFAGNNVCTGCHSAAGGMHDIAFKPHPALTLSNVVHASHPGYMPLVDAHGQSGHSGTIGCVTCHVPHGRAEGGGFVTPDWQATPEPLIHATKSMLRPYAAPNLCSSCHGPDGLRLFLYYHSTARSVP